MSAWLFEGKEVTEAPPKQYGFIYMITNTVDGRKYIGRKYLTCKKTKQVKKVVKKYTAESDWRDYWSSCEELQADVKRLGEDKFTREILMFCKTRGTTNYFEAKLIFLHEALESDKFYNGWVSCKCHKSHVLGKN